MRATGRVRPMAHVAKLAPAPAHVAAGDAVARRLVLLAASQPSRGAVSGVRSHQLPEQQ